MVSLGPGTNTATTLLWPKWVGVSEHGEASVSNAPSMRRLRHELLTV